MTTRTPGPWIVSEFDDTGGYDCMTAGVRVGPALLDGETYGQEHCKPMEPAAFARMMADATFIAKAVHHHDELVAALEGLLHNYGRKSVQDAAKAILAKAKS